MNPEKNYTLVDSEAALADLLQILELYDMAAVDTEADSMHHYAMRLCLIQITVGDTNWLLDPLADLDITPVFKTKAMQVMLFHGADYDLRLLYQNYGFSPKVVFDTMIAAKLLGKEKLGLANLVEEYFGITLSKDNQKADWTIRPLPEDMTDYAVHDTIYLHELVARLGEELQASGRFLWHTELCAQLIEHAKIQHEVVDDPWRISGSHHLPPRSLNLLKAVWYWRERQAELLDRPPYKVMAPDLMLAVVRNVSSSFPDVDFEHMPRLPRNFVGERYDSFKEMLETAVRVPVEEWPKADVKVPPPKILPDSDLLLALKFWRDKKAEKLGIEASLLANRNQLIDLAMPYDSWKARYDAAHLMNWQRELWNEILRDNVGKDPQEFVEEGE